MFAAGLALLFLILDVNGVERHPMRVDAGKANVLFFVGNDCPISNSYAHEIARICRDYHSRGVSCTLIYVDPSLTDEQARQHAQEYGHGDYPKLVDRRHEIVKAAGATVAPEAAVIDHSGKVVYLGRIDDSYAALGQPRRPAKNTDLRNALDEIVAGKPITKPLTHALGCYISDFKSFQ
jgi:hypothetical protein